MEDTRCYTVRHGHCRADLHTSLLAVKFHSPFIFGSRLCKCDVITLSLNSTFASFLAPSAIFTLHAFYGGLREIHGNSYSWIGDHVIFTLGNPNEYRVLHFLLRSCVMSLVLSSEFSSLVLSSEFSSHICRFYDT